MCGRYQLFTEGDIEEIKNIIDALNRKYSEADRSAMKTDEIFPTNTTPILTKGERSGMSVTLQKWGFPKWDGKGVIINAMSETASSKPMFRTSVLERRCIVPSTGFYEWRHEGKKTIEKYIINLPDEPVLYMAGIYDTFKDDNGIPSVRFVILTTAANGSISHIHDRMPVIVRRDERAAWLNGEGLTEIMTRPGPELILRAA